jgi:hypothetical protein
MQSEERQKHQRPNQPDRKRRQECTRKFCEHGKSPPARRMLLASRTLATQVGPKVLREPRLHVWFAYRASSVALAQCYRFDSFLRFLLNSQQVGIDDSFHLVPRARTRKPATSSTLNLNVYPSRPPRRKIPVNWAAITPIPSGAPCICLSSFPPSFSHPKSAAVRLVSLRHSLQRISCIPSPYWYTAKNETRRPSYFSDADIKSQYSTTVGFKP